MPSAHGEDLLYQTADAIGEAHLDLDLLAQVYTIGEADNVRWSLVRRTPSAATVHSADAGVDWSTLRQLTETGTILVPAGRPWSFNETFREGPGYKEAGGILAGGQCALATVFRSAAAQAGLPSESKIHARPIPGFSVTETVNILWGRDDLVVHNTTPHDLYLVWKVRPSEVEVVVAPVREDLPLPLLPDWGEATVALVYGHPGPGGWGSLGQTATADHALDLARRYAVRVDEWNGPKSVAAAVNPNAIMSGQPAYRRLYLHYLIAEARRQGYYVMLDVQTGDQAPLPLFAALMDEFLQENVWLDWDIEHTAGGTVDAAQINQVAELYFSRRRAAGYQSPGIFGFYVFSQDQVNDPAGVRRRYDGGGVVPIFDGFGGRGHDPTVEKITRTRQVLSLFGEGPYGIMEFETRWGKRFDQIGARAYLDAFPETQIMASQ
jgi:nucleotide-binding universal stress UspA family protein